jgi:dTDP-4-dehydrorhamnose reductase
VGHACAEQLKRIPAEKINEFQCLTRNQLDIANPDALADVVRRFKPTLLINAAAYTNVEKAEDEVALAEQVNGYSVGVLAELCKAQACLLVHYSTDYVFDGTARQPYLETDAIAPQSSYGRSKAMGEAFIAQVGGDAVVLRTGWVFARHGDNFYKKMLRFGNQREQLSVVDDQTGAPTPAEWLAQLALLWGELQSKGKGFPTGLFHAASQGQTTWYDYAELALDLAAGSPLLPKKPTLNRAKTPDMNFKAKRPAYSVLNTRKLQTDMGVTPPNGLMAVTQALMSDIEDANKDTQK